MTYYARSAGFAGAKQELKDHLERVAATAERFALDAALRERLAQGAGLLHDLGKCTTEFQELRVELGTHRIEHACQGAAIAAEVGAIETAIAVPGHHAGLKSRQELRELSRRGYTFSAGPDRCSRQSPAGLPTVVVEVLMFYEATAYWGIPGYPRLQDEADFLALLPRLTESQRYWIREAIALVRAGHPWLPQLSI